MKCLNCGKDLDYHTETQTDRCLKKISMNEFIAKIFEDLQKT